MRFIFLVVSVFTLKLCQSQDTNAFVPEGDAKYFSFWEGKWVVVTENNTLDSNNYFIVKKSVNPASYVEEWHFSNGMSSFAIRAWDKTAGKWGFVWISDNGLYQVWDTKKVDGHWYIYRNFDINGDKYLSRQGFIPQPDGTVIRISEKSYDDKSWELRFKQKLKKVN
jgi:hypothetical protein